MTTQVYFVVVQTLLREVLKVSLYTGTPIPLIDRSMHGEGEFGLYRINDRLNESVHTLAWTIVLSGPREGRAVDHRRKPEVMVIVLRFMFVINIEIAVCLVRVQTSLNHVAEPSRSLLDYHVLA